MEKNLTKDVDILNKISAKDHIINSIKAIISAIPGVGGTFSSLINDYIPTKKQERLTKFLQEISYELKKLSDCIDNDLIKKDEFAYIFEECLKGVLNNYQADKIYCYKGIFINSLIKDIEQTEKEYYLYLVNSLTDLHIKILSISNNPKAYFDAHSISEQQIIHSSLRQVFSVAISEINIELIKSAYQDLYNLGLINTDKSIFGTMTAAGGFEIVKGRITNTGKNFIEFCTNF